MAASPPSSSPWGCGTVEVVPMGGSVVCLARLEREPGDAAGRWDMVTTAGDKEGEETEAKEG